MSFLLRGEFPRLGSWALLVSSAATVLPPQPPGEYPPQVFTPLTGNAVAGLWPWPTDEVTIVDSDVWLCFDDSFSITTATRTAMSDDSPNRIQFAIRAYTEWLKRSIPSPGLAEKKAQCQSARLQGLHIVVEEPMEAGDLPPQAGANESYHLKIEAPTAMLQAPTSLGILRGLETFSQLVLSLDAAGLQGINASRVHVSDAPRFEHRGVMLDSSRHFLPIKDIESFLDAMLWNKMNVLHWHLTDAQSAPLRTPFAMDHGFDHGAYDPSLTYSRADLERVVTAASVRGIRVIPEIDSPSHVQSWATQLPKDMFIECGYNTLLNIVDDRLQNLMDGFLGEISDIFPDSYLHLGFDEVNFDCLNTSLAVKQWLAARDLKPDMEGLKKAVAVYIRTLGKIVAKHGKKPVYWNEVFDKYGPGNFTPTLPPTELPSDAMVELWMPPGWHWSTLANITAHGFKAVYAPDGPWYLDGGDIFDWTPQYSLEPLSNKICHYSVDQPPNCTCPSNPSPCYDISAEKQQVSLVLGGEAALWAEHIDASLLPLRAWPRASAVAERLWSRREVAEPAAAWPRLARQRCRMIARGTAVTPLGPGLECPLLPGALHETGESAFHI